MTTAKLESGKLPPVPVVKRDVPHRDIRDGIPRQQQDALDNARKDHTRQGTGNEVWPDPLKTRVTEVEGRKDESGKPILEYTNPGERKLVQVDRSTNPKLYDYLNRTRDFQSSGPTREYAKTQADEFGANILKRSEDLPGLKDVAFTEARGDAVMIATKDGKRSVVTRQLAPDSFSQAGKLHRTSEGIRMSEQHGYKNTIDDAYSNDQLARAKIGAEGEVGPGLIRAEIPVSDKDTRKIVVAKELNPNLYNRLSGKFDDFSGVDKEIDGARRKSKLPSLGETSPLDMKTTEKGPGKGDEKLTVSDLAWRNTIDKWSKGLKDGSIKGDDERAKLYNALRGKAAVEDGMSMVGLNTSKGQDPVKVTSDDMAAIIDKAKLDTRISDLMHSKGVQKDYLDAQGEAIKKLPDSGKVHDRLKKMAFGEDYVRHIADLKDSGREDVAKGDIARVYSGLSAFDQKEAARFAQSTMLNGLTVDLDKLMKDPGKISDENKALATKDTMTTVLSTLKKGGIDIPRRTVEVIDKFVGEFLNNAQQAKTFNGALQELGDKFNKNGRLSEADLEKVANAKDKPLFKALNEKSGGGALATIAELNRNGTLGSIGGTMSLASGIYQLTGKGGTLADTPEERLAVAKDFVSFLGAGQHFANLGSNIVDTVKGTNANKMLGLDKTLPQIFSTDKAQGGRPFTPEIGERFVKNFEEVLDRAAAGGKADLAERLNLSEPEVDEIRKGMINGYVKDPALPGANGFTRAASAALRVLDAGANVFAGVADTVLGGLAIKRGIAGRDPGTIATGAIQVGAGAFTFAGGSASAASLLGNTIGRALAGPFLGVGAALGAIAFLPQMIIQDIKHNKQMDGARKDLKDLMTDLDSQGVLKDDGGARYKFLDEYIHQYGQRDAPKDRSIFDYRSEEYDFYRREGSLPSAGFDEVEHKDYKGDGANIDTKLDGMG